MLQKRRANSSHTLILNINTKKKPDRSGFFFVLNTLNIIPLRKKHG